MTDLTFIEPVYNCQKRKIMDYTYYICEVKLKYNKNITPYAIKMDKNKRIISFSPTVNKIKADLFNQHFREVRLKTKDQVLKRVAIVNSEMKLNMGDDCIVGKAGIYYRARFGVIPIQKTENKKTEKEGLKVFFDMDISFYLTENMEVVAVMCDGGCFSQMEKDI